MGLIQSQSIKNMFLTRKPLQGSTSLILAHSRNLSIYFAFQVNISSCSQVFCKRATLKNFGNKEKTCLGLQLLSK